MTWTTVCKLADIYPGTGVCALLDGEQVAIFHQQLDGESQLFALSNYDPFSKANVISRGIVGCIKGELMVSSPIYKEHFSLETGQCLEDESVCLQVFDVRLDGDDVQLAPISDQQAA